VVISVSRTSLLAQSSARSSLANGSVEVGEGVEGLPRARGPRPTRHLAADIAVSTLRTVSCGADGGGHHDHPEAGGEPQVRSMVGRHPHAPW
jgi:hypothetical protein